jgi:hypothetical protein
MVTIRDSTVFQPSSAKYASTLASLPDRTSMVSAKSSNIRQQTPFESIEGALEYVAYLLAASREAQSQIEKEIPCACSPQKARKKQALQVVRYKLATLDFHIVKSKHLLGDLRKLRGMIVEEGDSQASSVSA